MGKDSGVGLPCPNGRCHSKPSQTSTPKLLYEKCWPWSANAGTSYPAGHFSYVFLLCTQGRKWHKNGVWWNQEWFKFHPMGPLVSTAYYWNASLQCCPWDLHGRYWQSLTLCCIKPSDKQQGWTLHHFGGIPVPSCSGYTSQWGAYSRGQEMPRQHFSMGRGPVKSAWGKGLWPLPSLGVQTVFIWQCDSMRPGNLCWQYENDGEFLCWV